MLSQSAANTRRDTEAQAQLINTTQSVTLRLTSHHQLYHCVLVVSSFLLLPYGSGLAGTRTSPFRILLELRMTEVVVTTGAVRRANCTAPNHSYRPTNSVKALKGK